MKPTYIKIKGLKNCECGCNMFELTGSTIVKDSFIESMLQCIACRKVQNCSSVIVPPVYYTPDDPEACDVCLIYHAVAGSNGK
jgi:hypothetical protein